MNSIFRYYLIPSFFIFIFCVRSVSAALTPSQEPTQEVISVYQTVSRIETPEFEIPTVVRVDVMADTLAYQDWKKLLLVEESTQTIQPIQVQSNTLSQVITRIEDGQEIQDESLQPENNSGFLFPFDKENEENTYTIQVSYTQPIMTEQLDLNFDTNVVSPFELTLSYEDIETKEDIVLFNRKRISSNLTPILYTSASEFTLVFYYDQPIQLNSISLARSIQNTISRSVYFLARPGETYALYSEPAGTVRDYREPEEGNYLSKANSAVPVTLLPDESNPDYIPPDEDNDGVINTEDNCIDVPNPDQEDLNRNGKGDACDDFDTDGVINARDNCIDVPNSRQIDTDGDGVGDKCDTEESRILERYVFLPWIGVAFGLSAVFLLLFLTLRKERQKNKTGNKNQQTKHPDSS